ncbi:MAG: ABC-F family ATP-binding cassette domain-containing protein [Candidatus Riflebacteria bacterium]|nr:ABC-F family ATP-binding cassette domain-containing protein [Candidatus Riflebacteria bacterium]
MIQVFDLTKRYGDQLIFDAITFALGRGERVGLVGRNGHGKSTLFRLILREEDPDEGRIMWPTRYRIGHLEQHVEFVADTVLAEGCLALPPEERDLEYKVEAIMAGLGFSEDDLSRPPAELSGGFQIRLKLGKLLLSEPDLLLLDEPTNYLDIASISFIEEYLSAYPGGILVVSHDRYFLEANLVQSRVKLLEKMGGKEELSRIESLDFQFSEIPFHAKTMMEIQRLAFGYPLSDRGGGNGQDGGRLLFEDLTFSIEHDDRIGVIGRNGKGKSTLLRLLAGELEPVKGVIKRHDDIRLGYFGQTNISRLTPSLTVEEEIQWANNNLGRTQVRGICGAMMFTGERAEKRISVLSGGEKSRTLLGKILAQPSNLLLLDEPTSHLDMDSIEALIDAVRQYSGAVVIVTHSELILKQLATKLVYFRAGAIGTYGGGYEDFLDFIGWDDEQEVY